MTTVEKVEAYLLAADLPEAWDFGIEPYRTSTCVVVKVSSASGAVGFGEAIARKGPAATTRIIIDLLAPLALGRDASDRGQIWIEGVDTLRRWGHSRGFLLEALSGLDIALWDLHAQELEVPVRELLPGGYRREVPVYTSSVYFQESASAAVKVAVQALERGAQALKIKIGHRPEQGGLDRDVKTVLAIREAAPSVELMLDANGAYTLGEALRVVRALADCDIVWLEEPFPADALDAYEVLAQKTPIALAAGESEFGVVGFRDLIARGAITYAQPDVARCGGFTGALQINDYCYAHHIPICPHTGFSGGINNVASMHLAATAWIAGPLEHMIIENPLRDLFTEPLPEPVDGHISVPDGPGLGAEISEDKLHKFSVQRVSQSLNESV